MLNEELYRQNREVFGEEEILIKSIEEMSELTQLISKYILGDKRITNIAEEVADVEIMLEQLTLLITDQHPSFPSEVDEMRRYKLGRQNRRIQSKLSDMRKTDESAEQEEEREEVLLP